MTIDYTVQSHYIQQNLTNHHQLFQNIIIIIIILIRVSVIFTVRGVWQQTAVFIWLDVCCFLSDPWIVLVFRFLRRWRPQLLPLALISASIVSVNGPFVRCCQTHRPWRYFSSCRVQIIQKDKNRVAAALPPPLPVTSSAILLIKHARSSRHNEPHGTNIILV